MPTWRKFGESGFIIVVINGYVLIIYQKKLFIGACAELLSCSCFGLNLQCRMQDDRAASWDEGFWSRENSQDYCSGLLGHFRPGGLPPNSAPMASVGPELPAGTQNRHAEAEQYTHDQLMGWFKNLQALKPAGSAPMASVGPEGPELPVGTQNLHAEAEQYTNDQLIGWLKTIQALKTTLESKLSEYRASLAPHDGMAHVLGGFWPDQTLLDALLRSHNYQEIISTYTVQIAAYDGFAKFQANGQAAYRSIRETRARPQINKKPECNEAVAGS